MAETDDIVARLHRMIARDATGYTIALDPDVIPLAATALTEQAAQIERLTAENEELRSGPWPKWATAVLKVIRKHFGYDGYDDALDGVDLPAELEELMSELEQQAERNLADARAEREVEQHKASTDHYRLKANEQRARATTAERERDEARAEVERLKKAVSAVTDATGAYLPPDGISASECISRTLGATDNPEINSIMLAEQGEATIARSSLTKGGENGDA